MKFCLTRITSLILAVSLPLVAAEYLSAAEKGAVVAGGTTDGKILLGELNCTACHAPGDAKSHLLAKQPPILASAASRLTPQYLREFLANPHQVKPGTTMPDALHSLTGKARDESVDLLVHYLSSLGKPIDQKATGSSLAAIERGKQLYHTIGCVACHEPVEAPPKHKSTAVAGGKDKDDASLRRSVPLGDLARKTTIPALAKFLNNPLAVRPSGRMPHLNLRPGEATLLAAYLLRDQYSEKDSAPGKGLDAKYYKGGHSRIPDFSKLTPAEKTSARNFDLKTIKLAGGKSLPGGNFTVKFEGLIEIPSGGEYRFWTKSDDGSVLWIDGKKVVDNDGIHGPIERSGRVRLTKGRHGVELGFSQSGGGYELSVSWQPPGGKRSRIPDGVLLHSAAAMIPKDIEILSVDPKKAAQGKAMFAKLGCASCHATDQPIVAAKAKPLSGLSPTGGCLSAKVAAGQPKFDLTAAQRKSLGTAITALKKPSAPPSPAQQLNHLMTSMNCFACHSRGGKGGPDAKRSKYFTYERLADLGEEGRMPPPLNETGAKLTAEGFNDVLIAGARYRTTMATRMPRFGKKNVGHLPHLWAKVDAGKIPAHKIGKSSRKVITDGRKLVGKSRLSCINCHAWGRSRLPGAEGLDLMVTKRRVRPEWFHAFMTNPQLLKPRTRMPSSWPEGKSFFSKIQGGDMHRQIDAVWSYLAAGSRGGMPKGLAVENTALLTPTDEPILFRAFVNGIGAETILVGYPERINIAFDPNRVRMMLVWAGDFVSTSPSWNGRAGQYTKFDRSSAVQFPDGPPLVRLDSLTMVWPKDKPKQRLGSEKTAPGYKFRGYRYDEDRIPTIIYDVHGIRVEETPTVGTENSASRLTRKLLLKSPAEMKNLYLLAATGGKIVAQGSGYLVDDKVKYTIVGGGKPMIRESEGRQELIVPVPVKAGGESTIELKVTW
jgi:cytochrome c2